MQKNKEEGESKIVRGESSETKKKSKEKKKEQELETSENQEEEKIEERVGENQEKVEEAKIEEKKEFKKIEKQKKISEEESWVPKTKLGNLVVEKKLTLEDIFKFGYKIKESEIVDSFIPDLEEEVIYIGGSPGKGGGIQRRAARRTVRIHKSGRRINLSAMAVVGNKNGYLGIGFGRALTNKEAIKKAMRNARINLFPVRRGCGSAECKCGEEHSIPFVTVGKTGSVLIKLMPTPKGVGLCAPNEIKKIFRLAGIRDIRIRSRGQTGTRLNFVYAVENALKNLNKMKL